MSSTRFPGKVLEPILGKPMICRQLERIRGIRRVDTVIVATSTEADDDPLDEIVTAEEITCFRGDLEDVLDRVYRAAASTGAKHVVRLTADCPLIDPEIVDKLVELHLAEKRDYSSNFFERRFPDGLDAEIATIEALETAWRCADTPRDREHVTPFIYRHAERYSIGSLRCDRDLAAHRWTVDHPKDLEFVRRIFELLYPVSANFSMWDVLELIERQPELSAINAALSEYAQ